MKDPLIHARAALLMIDIQQGFSSPYWGKRNNPAFEENAKALLTDARNRGIEVIHIQHLSTTPESPLRPGQSGAEFQDFATPENGERIFQKNVNSAFIGTALKEYLDERNLRTLVFCGLTSDHCVSTSIRMAANFGYRTLMAYDATATFDRYLGDVLIPADEIHRASLASLNGEFAELHPSRSILDQVTSSSAKHR